jgi:hypothetical protein
MRDRIRPVLTSYNFTDHIQKLVEAYVKYQTFQPRIQIAQTPPIPVQNIMC